VILERAEEVADAVVALVERALAAVEGSGVAYAEAG